MAILSLGNFTQPAAAVNQVIAVPSNLDYLRIYNYTQYAGNAGANANFLYWTRAMGTTGIYQGVAGGVAVAGVTAANAFVLYTPTSANTTLSAPIAITNINAATGVVLTATTTGLSIGSIILLSNLAAAAAQEIAGIQFTVSAINPGVSFTIQGYAGTTIPVNPTAGIGATAGFYRIVTPGLFYPKVRTLSNIAVINGQTTVSTTVNHGYSVGQKVRFKVPLVTAIAYGITQLDGVQATIIAANAANVGAPANVFFIDTDITGFGAFSFPVAAAVPFTVAEVNPFGDDSATALAQVPALSSLQDSVYNSGFLGMTLATGANLPGGVAADVVYWEAGKVDFGGL